MMFLKILFIISLVVQEDVLAERIRFFKEVLATLRERPGEEILEAED